jgi:hypothetical protein
VFQKLVKVRLAKLYSDSILFLLDIVDLVQAELHGSKHAKII